MSAALEVLLAAAPQLEEDLLLALRFAYYVKAAPLAPDEMYDGAEREFIGRPEVEDSPLMQPGSDNEADYPPRIRALWLYLAFLREARRPKTRAPAIQTPASGVLSARPGQTGGGAAKGREYRK